MERDMDGNWGWLENPPETMNTDYKNALPGYLTSYDKLLTTAKTRSEFDFVLALIHHGFDSHSDPFETTKRTFHAIAATQDRLDDYDVEVSIALWLYGHIIEASYPYQIIGDMIGIATGQPHRNPIFAPDKCGGELSPGRKITEIEDAAKAAGLKRFVKPLRASWNADLRNAVFHSNYAIVGDNLRLLAVGKTLPVSKVLGRVNRAIAAFEAFVNVLDVQRSQYTEPIQIDTPYYWGSSSGGKVMVVVREGYGPVAIYDTVGDIDVASPAIVGRLTAQEMTLVNQGVFHLPPRKRPDDITRSTNLKSTEPRP